MPLAPPLPPAAPPPFDWFLHFSKVMQTVRANPVVLLIVLGVNLVWLVLVAASKAFGIQPGYQLERRQARLSYAFAAAQHTQRLEKHLRKPRSWTRLFLRLTTQHKLLRIICFGCQLGEDPRKILSVDQNATILALLVQLHLLTCSLVWHLAQRNDVATGFLQRVAVGSSSALLLLPVSILLDRLFWKSRRVTHSVALVAGKSSEVQRIARAAMHVAVNYLDVQVALQAWRETVEDLKVAEVQGLLSAKRQLFLLGLVETTEPVLKLDAKEAEIVPPRAASWKTRMPRWRSWRRGARVASTAASDATARAADSADDKDKSATELTSPRDVTRRMWADGTYVESFGAVAELEVEAIEGMDEQLSPRAGPKPALLTMKREAANLRKGRRYAPVG